MTHVTPPRRRRYDRRKHDRRIAPWENWYRDLWLLIISAVVLWAALSLQATGDRIHRERRFALGVTCAVESAVAEAGRSVILGGGHPAGSPRFEVALERLGYPPLKARERAAVIAARAYVDSISTRVVANAGSRGQHLIRPDGSLDCRRFEQAAAATGQ